MSLAVLFSVNCYHSCWNCSQVIQTTLLLYNGKMPEKHLWRSDILVKLYVSALHLYQKWHFSTNVFQVFCHCKEMMKLGPKMAKCWKNLWRSAVFGKIVDDWSATLLKITFPHSVFLSSTTGVFPVAWLVKG